MKPQSLILFFLIIFFIGCKKEDNTPTNPYGGENGQVTFWCSNNTNGVFPVNIKMNGANVGTIGGLLTTAPDCNASDKVVKYIAAPGTYNMYSTSANGGNWSGTITITKGNCQTQVLQ